MSPADSVRPTPTAHGKKLKPAAASLVGSLIILRAKVTRHQLEAFEARRWVAEKETVKAAR